MNVRAREHELSIKNNENAHLPAHVRHCMCVPNFRGIKILGKSRDTTARELLEAFHISSKGDGCISDTSISLKETEMMFLRGTL